MQDASRAASVVQILVHGSWIIHYSADRSRVLNRTKFFFIQFTILKNKENLRLPMTSLNMARSLLIRLSIIILKLYRVSESTWKYELSNKASKTSFFQVLRVYGYAVRFMRSCDATWKLCLFAVLVSIFEISYRLWQQRSKVVEHVSNIV